MSTISLLARNCTLFTTTKALDEDAYRESLQRFVDFKIGPFLASGGSGEANSLSWDEVRRVYQIGVEVCRGKVPVYANMPEVRSAQEAIDFSRLAIEAGVDIVNLYGPASLHGYRPTDTELTAYFDEVLTAINHPVTLAPNPIAGLYAKGGVDCRPLQPISPGRVSDAERLRRGRLLHRSQGWAEPRRRHERPARGVAPHTWPGRDRALLQPDQFHSQDMPAATSIATSVAISRRPTRSTRTCIASTVSWSSGVARAGRRWR